MTPYLVELQGIGFLASKSVYINPDDSVSLTSEISVMINPADGVMLEYDKATKLVATLNKKEGHKRWKAVARSIAVSDFTKYGSKP